MARFTRMLQYCLAVLLAGASLSSCLPGTYLKEPKAKLDKTSVSDFASDTRSIMRDLASAANVNMPGPYSMTGDWYEILLAGFNYVDQRCDAYIGNLFSLDRARKRNQSLLLASASTTSAILSATGVPAKAMTIVAQAFGFASTATNIYADSFLYKLDPTRIAGLVLQTRQAYKLEAASRKASFTTLSQMFQALQGYIALCLPVTIEAQVSQILDQTRAVGDPAGRSTGGGVIGVVFTAPPAVIRSKLENDLGIPTATAPPISGRSIIDHIPGIPGVPTGAISDVEKTQIKIDELKAIQAIVCAKVDGAYGKDTRTALLDFQKGRYDEAAATDEVDTEGKLEDLRAAIAAYKTCADSEFTRAYEAGFVARQRTIKIFRDRLAFALKADKVREFHKEKLDTLNSLAASLTKPAVAGEKPLNVDVRSAIQFLREAYGLKASGGHNDFIDPDLGKILIG